MSGLPSGQFVDYLVIGVFAAAAVTVFGALVHGNIRSRPGKIRAIIAIPILISLTILGHVVVQSLMPPEPAIHVQIDPSAVPSESISSHPGGVPSPTPTAAPGSAPAIIPRFPSVEPDRKGKSSIESFIGEYVAAPAKRINGQWAIVIVARPDDRENYTKVINMVKEAVTEAGHPSVAIFRPSITSKNGFNTLFAADPAISRSLHEYCDQILVGKVTSDLQNNPVYPELLKLTLTIDIKIISTNTGNVEHQIHASAVGAGSDGDEARSNAEENLVANVKAELRTSIAGKR